MRVLVVCPMHRTRMLVRPIESMLAMNWPKQDQVDFLFMVGSDDVPEGEIKPRKCNEGRQVALSQGYDAMMVWDSDIIGPPNALEKLWATGADVAFGLYVLRHGFAPWMCATNASEWPAELQFMSNNPDLARASWGQVREVQSAGDAFMLVRRRVLEQIAFRASLFTGTTMDRATDWFYSIDANRAGFKLVCDLGVICGHMATDPLRIYWPDPNEETLYREQTI